MTGERWYAFVRFEGIEHEREGHLFPTYEQAQSWRENAVAERPGVVASGLLPEAVRASSREFVQQQRRDREL